jgi:phospholipid/cholesterol/gamma-HCH transport system substrate-binding protein
MQISKEFKVGILAIVTSVILYTGVNFLKGIEFFSTAKRYYVIYDNIAGLNVSSPVVISGYTVGRVENIKLLSKQGYKLLLTIKVDKKIELTDSTIAVLVETSPLGDKAIQLVIKEGNFKLKNNDTIPSKTEKGLISSLNDKIFPVMNNLDESMNKVNSILQSVDEKTIQMSLENIQKTISQMNSIVEENKKYITQTTQNLMLLSKNLIETERNVAPILQKLNTVSDSLQKAPIKQTFTSANQLFNQMNETMARLNRGEGTLGKLSKNDSLYVNMNNSANNLSKLLEDLRLRPIRYVHFSIFGRKENK